MISEEIAGVLNVGGHVAVGSVLLLLVPDYHLAAVYHPDAAYPVVVVGVTVCPATIILSEILIIASVRCCCAASSVPLPFPFPPLISVLATTNATATTAEREEGQMRMALTSRSSFVV